MSYATVANLETRFGAAEVLQLSDRDGNGTADAGVIQQALDDADALINGHLAARYQLPLASVPPVLVQYACDIARFLLFKDAAPEVVARRYQDALRFLERVASGTISLGVQPAPAAAAPAAAAASAAPVRSFTDDALAGL